MSEHEWCSYCNAELTPREIANNITHPIKSSSTEGLAWAACDKCRLDASMKIKALNRIINEFTDDKRGA